jgi:xanthine/uracil permease
MGIDMLRQVDLRERGQMYTLAAGLTMGLLPILVPGLYSKFPPNLQVVLGNGLAMGAVTAAVVNLLFQVRKSDGEAADPHPKTRPAMQPAQTP